MPVRQSGLRTHRTTAEVPSGRNFSYQKNMIGSTLHAQSLLRCRQPFRNGCRTHIPLPPVPTSQLCLRRWSRQRLRAGVDDDPYYNLFKSKVFQSDLVVKEFDRYVKSCGRDEKAPFKHDSHAIPVARCMHASQRDQLPARCKNWFQCSFDIWPAVLR